MHDLFSSGVCKIGFEAVLLHYIKIKKIFTLDKLNVRRRLLGKQSLDSSLSRMPDVEFDNKSHSYKIRTTSAEMRSFCHFFTSIIGLLVPIDDPVWNYVKCLVNLVDFALLPSFKPSDIDKLNKLTKLHHELFLEHFPNETLRPKHHHLVHYGRVINASGPVGNLMCFRQEAKHSIFIKYAHIVSSRKNISYTLAMKAGLQFSHDSSNEVFFKGNSTDNFTITQLETRSYFIHLIHSDIVNTHNSILSAYNWKIHGIIYKNGTFVTYTQDDVTELYEIVEILNID